MNLNLKKLTTTYQALRHLQSKGWMPWAVLNILKKNSLSVGDLAAWVNTRHSYASQALTGLQKFGLVTSEKKGKETIYSIDKEQPTKLISFCLFMADSDDTTETGIRAAITKTDQILHSVCKKTVGNNRLRILELLELAPGIGVNDIYNRLQLSQQPLASTEKKILVDAGFVTYKKEGKNARLSLNHAFLAKLEEATNTL